MNRVEELAQEREEKAAANRRALDEHRQQVEADYRAEQAAKSAARDAERVAALTEQLRLSYLQTPGATSAAFQAALPDLLEAHRRDEARHGFERELAKARANPRYAL